MVCIQITAIHVCHDVCKGSVVSTSMPMIPSRMTQAFRIRTWFQPQSRATTGATVGTMDAAINPQVFIHLPTTDVNCLPISVAITHDSIWATPALPNARLQPQHV